MIVLGFTYTESRPNRGGSANTVVEPSSTRAVAAASTSRLRVMCTNRVSVIMGARSPNSGRLSAPRLAIGSALACIGLTVPIVVMASITFGLPLILGLSPKEMVVLAVTFLVSAVTLGTGRTYVMQGAVHLILFAAYLFLAFVP